MRSKPENWFMQGLWVVQEGSLYLFCTIVFADFVFTRHLTGPEKQPPVVL